MFEAMCHDEKCFLTTTYDKEHLPNDGSVSVRHLQEYLKRVRARIYPRKIRYYGVGEYGERSGRPHYHLALYGVQDVDMLREAWGQGEIDVGFLEPASAAYICGYVAKKWGKVDGGKVPGRRDEFARMSLKPGIGAEYAEAIAASCTTKGGSSYLAREGDVPRVVRLMGKMWPLARYMRSKVREQLGMDEGNKNIMAWRKYERQLHETLEAGGIGKASEKVWARRNVSRDRARYFQSQANVRKEI